jgi:hypothetical protein
MTRRRFFLAAMGIFVGCSFASAQTAGVLYTWNGTGNIQDWGNGNVAGVNGGPNGTTIANSTPGQLTITETGDQLDPSIKGEAFVIQDGFNRRTELSMDQGGLDLTGLDYIELDVSHTGTANVDVQMFIQTTPAYNYLWYGPGPTFMVQGPDWSLPPNVVNTLRFPVNQLTTAQQAWINSIGLSVRDHAALNDNLTWNISEVRSVGAGLTVRNLATHDAGSLDNGLNGAYVNFGNAAVLGNDGGQNQTGLSQDTTGSGSLKWTDKGNHGDTNNPSGAAITWGNGTGFTFDPSHVGSFFERLVDASNYNRLTFRVKATDVTPGGGGSVGLHAFFQNGNYVFQVAGADTTLAIDGQYHDLVFPLTNVTNLANVQAFGLQLFGHANDIDINVDNVQFSKVAGVPGDYNGNGVVDMADYVLWRKNGPLQNEVNTPGTVDASDYDAWRARFGNTSGSGSLNGPAVPEPTGLALLFATVVGGFLTARRHS